MSVGVLTDTTASIPAAMVEELGIEIVPYYVHRGLETLRGMIDIQPSEFAQWLASATKLPTTSNPSPGDYVVGLQHLAARATGIVALTMTSKGSGAYQSCLSAVDQLHEQSVKLRVEVIDTLQVAMSHGWAAIEAARAALRGSSLEDVAATAREVARRGMMLQTADTLRYLHMGGRIGRAQHLVGSILNIKPIIGMEDGVIAALGTARSRLQAYRRMVEMMQRHAGGNRRIQVAYTHVSAPDHVALLRSIVEQEFECQEIIVTELSPALAVHSGPGTVGVSFCTVAA